VTTVNESMSAQLTSHGTETAASLQRSSIVAGIGALAFGVLTIVGLALINPPGGTYKESNVTAYLEKGHRFSAFAGLYVEILAVIGLILVLAFLRNGVRSAATQRLFWVLGLFGAGSIVMGWTIMDAGAFARAVGGSSVVVSAPTTYLITQVGATIAWGPGAIFLALALIALAGSSRPALPSWLRWLTLVLAVIALASPAFFPSFALPVWAVVTGIWLLAASGRIGSATGASS
jgi:hypothetical protein